MQPGIVTLVEVQVKRADRVNVYLDDEYAFSLSSIVAEAVALRPGTFLSADNIAHLLENDAFQKATDTALAFLAYRPRSEREVRQNLQRKRIPESLIDRVVHRLREMRLIDDAAFAQFWLQNREAFSPRGEKALRSELRRKGVDSGVVDHVLDGSIDEATAAYAAAQRKARLLRNLDDYKSFYRRLGGYLIRRGFAYEIVKSTVDKCWRERGQ
ncbi:MAG: RecX family transcriptional regulator [Chloroflexi bacterium]|nr:RecX family transcriptional regulator [Chloroflexota bacterium]